MAAKHAGGQGWLVLHHSPPDSPWLPELQFSLRHVTTGQLLTVTGSHYPDWGQALLEVAGTSKEGPASTWRIKYYRAPSVGWLKVASAEPHSLINPWLQWSSLT